MPDTIRFRPTPTTVRAAIPLGAATLALLAVVATAGCQRPEQDLSTGGVAGLGSGPTPTAAADPGPDDSEVGGEQAAPPPDGPEFPDTPKGYAEAVLAAWDAPDLDRLAELTTPVVYDQIIQIPGPPPADWTWIQCDNIAYCTFYNSAGDHLALQIPVAALGGPDGAVQIALTQTTYPDDHLEYLKEFTAAWLNGNLARMHQLARPEVVDAYLMFNPGPVANYGLAGGGGGLSIVVVTGVGFEIDTHIGTTLLGGPQAIVGAVPEI
jgi:hypothetical protein